MERTVGGVTTLETQRDHRTAAAVAPTHATDGARARARARTRTAGLAIACAQVLLLVSAGVLAASVDTYWRAVALATFLVGFAVLTLADGVLRRTSDRGPR